MPPALDRFAAPLRSWQARRALRSARRNADEQLLESRLPSPRLAWRTAEQLRRYTRDAFDVVDYHPIPVSDGWVFHCLTLRRRD